MSDTTFVAGTVVTKEWLNDVNDHVYGSIVNVKTYGAVGDGITDDTDALRNAFATSKYIEFEPGKTYLVNADGYPTLRAVLNATSQNSVVIIGNNATLKFSASSTGPIGLNFIELTNCNNVLIKDLIFDGNSANQNYGYHSVAIFGGENIKLINLTCNNMYFDGVYVRATTPATFSTYPKNVYIENITTYNCGRNGISIIGANGIKIKGGYLTNTVGDPGAGIDVEPNSSDVWGVRDLEIDGVVVKDNYGRGIVITGNAAVSTDTPYCLNAILSNITAYNNAAGADVNVGGSDVGVFHCADFVLNGFNNPGQTTDPIDAGLVYIASTAQKVVLNNLSFNNVQFPTTTKSLVYLDSSDNETRVINNVTANSCTGTVVRGGKYSTISNVLAEDCTGEYTVLLGNGRGTLRNSTFIRSSLVQAYNVSNTGLYSIEGITFIDPTARAMRLYIANSTVQDIKVRHTGTAATQAIWIESITNCNLNNFFISDNGGYWNTVSQAYLVTQSSVSGNRIRSLFPSILSGSKTSYDPASLADGAATSTTVSLHRADVGDACQISTSISLAGIMAFASITAANTATVTYFNKTGGAVDLASHTLTVEAIK